MVMESKYGQMGPDMRGTGSTIRHVVRASSGMLMGMSLKENGKTIRLMAMGSMCI